MRTLVSLHNLCVTRRTATQGHYVEKPKRSYPRYIRSFLTLAKNIL